MSVNDVFLAGMPRQILQRLPLELVVLVYVLILAIVLLLVRGRLVQRGVKLGAIVFLYFSDCTTSRTHFIVDTNIYILSESPFLL